MRQMSKSAVRVAREALATGQAALPTYGSRWSRHDYKQPQLFALLVLRQFLKTDYRGVVALVAEWGGLRRALELRKVPHYSTLAHASRRRRGRGAFGRAQAALVWRARAAGLIDRAPVATVDATGLETRHVSAYFGMRRAGSGHRQRAWSKLTAVVYAHSHLILGAVPGVGPSQDSPDFTPAMRQAAGPLPLNTALADAAYDAEHNHRLCREDLGVRHTATPLNPRNTGRRWPRAPYQRAMRRRFPRTLYRQRWHAESGFSRHKRRLGSALTARGDAAQGREFVLRVLTHNLMLVAAAS